MSLGLVLYTDGGCEPPRGIGAWGVHGYTYDTEAEKPKAPRKENAPTNVGYRFATEFTTSVQPVQVLEYIDGYGPLVPEATNNIAELRAMQKALEVTLELKVTQAHFVLDSEYVHKGLVQHSPTWKRQRWLKADGQPIKNIEIWQQLVALYETAKETIALSFSHVDGHGDGKNDSHGNNIADYLASAGKVAGKNGQTDEWVEYSPATRYRVYDSKYNRMFATCRWYFTVRSGGLEQRDDDRFVYFCGDHGKEDELCGKQTSDNVFSVLFTPNREPVLDILLDKQEQITQDRFVNVVIAHLDNVLTSKRYAELLKHGGDLLDKDRYHNDLYTVDRQILTYEANPPRRVFDAISHLNLLRDRLDEYLTDASKMVVTDVTDSFYGQVEEKKKTVLKIRPEISSATKAIKVDVGYNCTGEPAVQTLTLTFGLDVPRHNVLSALAPRDPKLKLLTWRESDHGFRYALIIEAEEDIQIWCPVYSNLYTLKKKKEK